MLTSTKLITVLIVGLLLHGKLSAETVGVFTDGQAGQLQFAAGDIEAALKAHGYTVERPPMTSLAAYANSKVVIALNGSAQVITVLGSQGGTAPAALGEQAYQLQTTTPVKRSYWVLGGDLNGAMYGGLQLAENIQSNGISGTYAETVAPHILRRGAKLNLSMDQRLPTYAGNKLHTSSAISITAVWNMAFWKEWLDQQARNRMNLLTLWVHNPFPALVTVPGFEKATLPYIMGTSDHPVVGGEQLTISKRIDFWKEVMRHAKERGFDFYVFNWNVTPDYAKDQGIGITDRMSNAVTKQYFNNAVKKLLETYPDLSGFGVSPGDNMNQIGSGSDAQKAENAKWIYEAYSKGIADFAKENPSRKLTFVHRQINVELTTSKNHWKTIEATYPNLTLDVSMKYCNANTYSTTTPQIANGDLSDLADFGGPTWLTLRNDGFFYADFGNPTWVRDFIRHLPSQRYTDGPHQGKPLLRGVYLGHDAYSPTWSYLYKTEALNRNDQTGTAMLEIQRKWYMEMLWGRLAYHPNTSDDAFRLAMAQRYPTLPATKLFTAWSKATGPIARIEELVQGTWNLDSEFYHELCMWRNNGNNHFRTIRDFVWDGQSNEPTQVAKGSEERLASIKETADGKANGRTTAFALADEVEADAWTALSLISEMGNGGGGRAEVLLKTLQQQAFICTYYAYKIRGATFKEQGKLAEARTAMGNAYGWWMRYVASMDAMWKPDETRTYDLTDGGWNQWNSAVLKEFHDLGGSGTPSLPQLPTTGSAPVITSAATIAATAGQSFLYQITATNTPTTYGASGLPANVTVNTGNGQVSGTIATTGQVTFSVTAANASGTGSQTVTLTVSGSPGNGTEIRINFQPSSAPTVAGFAVDSGKPFGLRSDGRSYGWNRDVSSATRDRNDAQSPDQLKDTMILTQKDLNTPTFWEIAIENGTYDVRVVAGDPDYYSDDMTYCFTIEGVVVLNQNPSAGKRWVEDTDPVVVKDGRLTLGNSATAVRNRLCFIEITRIPTSGN